jgi:hypothetical protein
VQLPPEYNLPCWHCSQYFDEVARTARKYFATQSAAAEIIANIYRRALVFIDHDVTYCINMIIVGVAYETDGDDNSDSGSDDYNDWRWVVIQFVSSLLKG